MPNDHIDDDSGEPRRLLDLPGEELVLTLHEPVLVLGADLVVSIANSAFLTEFALSADEVVGRSVYAMRDELWRTAEVQELFERVVPGHDLIEDHYLALPGQGPFGAGYRVNVRPLRTGENELRSLIVAFRREWLSREAFEDGPGSLRALAVERGADVVVLYSTTGRCVYLGSSAAHILGYEPREWRALSACDLVHPDDQEAFFARLAPPGGSSGVVQAIARARRADGEYAWVEVTAQRVEHSIEGELVHAAIRDVTQRRRAEDALRWLSGQTKLILDTAAEGIFGLDTLGVVTFANPAAASVIGRAVDEIVGHPYTLFVPERSGAEGEQDETEDAIGYALREGVACGVMRSRFLRADGEAVQVEYTCSPARQHGRVVGAVVTFRDVSERRRAEEAIRRTEWAAAVGQTVQAFRHEINNPLSALLAGVQLLEMGGNTLDEEKEMVAAVGTHARRIRDAVRRLTIAPPGPGDGLGS